MQSAMHHKEQGPISQIVYEFRNEILLFEIYFSLLLILIIQSGHNFAHAMTAELSCHDMCKILT